MPQAGRTHDITLAYFDGGGLIGLMLRRNRSGLRDFQIRDAETIPPRTLTTDELTQAAFPAQLELVWFEEDWQLGIGGETHRLDPKKVATAVKMDFTESGKAQPAREGYKTTLSADPDEFYPSGFALASPDADPGDSGILQEIWAFIGSYTFAGGDNDWVRIAEPQNFNIYYGNGVQFNERVLAPGRNAGTDVADAPFPYIYKDPTAATWVASTLTAGRFKFFAKARDNGNQEVLWGAHHIFDTGFTLSGDHSNSDTTLTLSADPTAVISVGDILMMGAGGSQELLLVTATSSSDPHLTVVRQYGSAAVDPSGGEKIYLYQPHVIKSSTSPENSSGSWSSAVAIGRANQPITGLIVDQDTNEIFVAKTDGLWSYGYDQFERTTERNLTIEFRQQQHSGNFLGAYSWNRHILLPLGAGGLLDFNPDTRTIRDVSFRSKAPGITAYHGVVLALHGDSQNLFMLLKDNSVQKIYLLQGELVTFDGVEEFRWSPVYEATAEGNIQNNQTGLMVESGLDDHRRVWWGFTDDDADTDETPRFYPFGIIGDDQTDGFTNDTDTEWVTTRYDGNLPRVPKRVSKIEIGSKDLGADGRQIAFDYRVDEENFITGDAFSISPVQEIELEHGTTGKIIEFKFKPTQTTVGTTNPVMDYFRVTLQIRPDPTKVYPVSVVLEDDQLLLNGATESKIKKNLAQLREWNASPADVTLTTPDGESRAVIFLPGTMREKQLSHEFGRRVGTEVTFFLAEVV